MAELAIFLGAGASCADGAPVQSNLFREYFTSRAFRQDGPMNAALARFFRDMFSINVARATTATFPTFEEALGLCDLAILRKERFRKFSIDDDPASLRRMSRHLVFLMARILELKLRRGARVHRTLVQNLLTSDHLPGTAFVSTNYDILIDNALSELRDQRGIDVDYGVDFWNFGRRGDWQRPDPVRSVLLLKPHGSLNWLVCTTCNQLKLTPRDKVVTRLISDPELACEQCRSVYSPLIVPPTFYKDLGNVFLATIWNKAESALRSVKHIVFCGYSFPDADMHIKYLLKRVQTNRRGPLAISVVNHHAGKKASAVRDEETRFRRFFGPDVNFTRLSFAQFAKRPAQVLV